MLVLLLENNFIILHNASTSSNIENENPNETKALEDVVLMKHDCLTKQKTEILEKSAKTYSLRRAAGGCNYTTYPRFLDTEGLVSDFITISN